MAGVFLLAMTLINAAGVWRLAPLLKDGYQDFTAFYTGGEMVRDGQTAQLYDRNAQYVVEKRIAPNVRIRQAALPYNHPPFEALFFWPLAYLNYLSAYLLWTFFNVVLLTLSLGRVRRTFAEVGALSPVVAGLAATAYVPVVIALLQGQDAILLLFLFTCALTLLEQKHDFAAGAALGLGLFKFHFALPLALVLAVRRPRLLIGMAPVGALLVAVSATMVGWKGIVDYVLLLTHLEKSGGGGAIPALQMPNLRGLIAELLGMHGASGFAMGLTLACSVVVMGAALWVVRRREASLRITFAVASVASVLVSYHALIHDVAWLLVVVLLLFAMPVATRSGMRLDLILLVATYAIFLSSSIWHWLAPFWCVPVVFWIFRKYGGRQPEVVA